jgi:cyclophilin family peptidyl-prolyl cis-trans isomerase
MAALDKAKKRRLAQRFCSFLKEDCLPATRSRAIRFEPLESRQLMAADFFASAALASETNGLRDFLSPSAAMQTSQSLAEGEAAPDLVAFAKSLRDAGVIFFGADWCSQCQQQKALFEDGGQFLNFIEVTNPDRTPNQRGIDENVTTYPTWQFQNGSRQTGLLTLQQLSTASGIAIPNSSSPSIAPLSNATVLRGSPLHIPVDAYDPNGNPLTISVVSSNPAAVAAEVLTGNSSARFETNFGPMVFELFDVEGGRAASRFKELAQQGFYNTTGGANMTFHRVIENFVIQGGDPTATGSGGSSLPNFDDQFDVDLQHNRSGILSYAKSTDDTNDSQFFITAGPTRHLDFNHSIFGQLVEGDANRRGIARTAVNASDKPVRDAIINSVTIFEDLENGLVRLRAVGTAGQTAVITVTIADSEGNQTSANFVATVANDTSNGAPFLNDLAAINVTAGQPIQFQLTSQDKEGDTVRYTAVRPASQSVNYTVSVNATTGLVTVTPPADFVGSFQVLVGVNQTPNASTSDQNDTQLVTINVAPGAPSAPTSIDLASSSDSGSSDNDNLTNAGTLTFTIGGTINGATITLRAGSTVIGSTVATGTTTTLTTANLAALGSGTYSLSATQSIGGQSSSASPGISLTFDNIAPSSLSPTVFPASVPLGETLSVNLAHAEEGNGLVYALLTPPAGMTIQPATGLVTWSPSQAQLGAQSFGVQLTDAAGNTRTDNFTVNVSEAALGRIRLQPVDLAGTPLSSVSVGQSFKLQAIAEDLRGNPTGVFAAYFDLNYDAALVELDGANPITRKNNFDITPAGATTTPGLIDELGAARNSTAASLEESLVFVEVQFKAKATGQVNFTSDPAEGNGRSFLLYDLDTAVPSPRVAFGAASLAIGRNFTANNDSFNFNEDSVANSMDVLANDTINAGSNAVLSIIAVGATNAGGTVTIASDSRSLRYTPAANYHGGESFTYSVRDNNGAEAIATVTVQVQPVNDPPVANGDSYTVIEGSNDNFFDVLINDNDGVDSGESLSISGLGTPSAGGSARVNGGSNAILYSPRSGFTGTETLTYTLRDNNGGTATATVSITVNPLVPPPTAVNDAFTLLEDAVAADFDVLANDLPSQPGETLTVISGSSANGGTVSASSNNTRLRYTPRSNFHGTDVVTYRLVGSNGGQTNGTVTFNVTAVNDPPVANDDVVTVLSQPNQLIQVLGNDTTVDTGETLIIVSITQPPSGQGSLELVGNTIRYTAPSVDFTGSFAFSYTLGDGSGLTDPATVNVTVRNFVPRSIGGNLVTSGGAGGSAVTGISLQYRGTSETGETIQRTAPVSNRGAFSISDLPPGNYSVTVPDLPFVAGGAGNVQIVSRPDDGDTSGLQLAVGTIDARYVDVRDFLGKTIGRGITAAVANGQSQQWLSGKGAWRNYRSLNLSMNAAGNSLQIQAVNDNNQTFQASVPMTDTNLVSVRATEGNTRLIRLLAHPEELNLAPVANALATQAEAEGEAGETVGSVASSQSGPPSRRHSFLASGLSPTAVDGFFADSDDAMK